MKYFLLIFSLFALSSCFSGNNSLPVPPLSSNDIGKDIQIESPLSDSDTFVASGTTTKSGETSVGIGENHPDSDESSGTTLNASDEKEVQKIQDDIDALFSDIERGK